MKSTGLIYSPREYQNKFLDTAHSLIKSNPEGWHLFSAPTGTGKSICEWMLLQDFPYWLLITPRIEIISGMLQKIGHDIDELSIDQIVKLAQKYRIYTPIRLRNILSRGELPFKPEGIIIDEAHHDLAETYQQLDMYCNYVPKVGLTASPYRGNAKDTQKFLQRWGNKVHEIISLKEAIEQKYFALPVPSIWPLLDDDEVNVSGGEFKVESVNSKCENILQFIVDRIKPFYNKKEQLYDRPTMIAVSSQLIVHNLVKLLNSNNLPACGVTQGSNGYQRKYAFKSLVDCRTILVQIDVVSEGVDLPIERIIDIKPTLSPVRWIQQIGRMRIKDDLPVEYICCCRNLERHGYLMEGYFPNSIFKEAQEVFNDKPSFRSGMRAIGLEGMGRFVNTPVHLLNGVTAFLYNLVTMDGFKKTEYCILIHPNHIDTLKCKRESTVKEKDDYRTIYNWGNWEVIDYIPDVRGYSSPPPMELTDKQRNWYLSDATKYGLNPHKEVTNRNFQILPLLKDISRQMGRVVKLS